jgi:hypothetical protein
MMFRVIFWDILPCKMMVDRRFTSETSVYNHFTRQYISEDNSEHQHSVTLQGSKSNVSEKSAIFLVKPF